MQYLGLFPLWNVGGLSSVRPEHICAIALRCNCELLRDQLIEYHPGTGCTSYVVCRSYGSVGVPQEFPRKGRLRATRLETTMGTL